MRVQRSWMPAVVVAVISLASGGWLLQQSVPEDGGVYSKARLLEEVHRLISDRYVEQTDPGELYQMAIDGMLLELGDPYTTFLDREEWEDLRLSTTGNYGGLGIRIDSKDGWITVVGVLPNTPAEKAGLQTGDRILEVEGETAENWTTDEAVRVLRGPKGSPVSITVGRVGVDQPLHFNITRDEIHVVAVQAFMLDDRVGYLKLDPFPQEAREEVRRAIDGLLEKGATSLVFDLRQNPGGLLEEGIAIADLFLPEGAEVVETRSRLPDQNQSYSAPSGEVYTDLPLVVLVNNWSASASEIVAGSLQDHDRALIVGTQTFGKGSVQTLYGLSGGNYLKVTTATWYTPAGRSIQKPRDRQTQVGELMAEAVAMDGDPVDVSMDTTEREVFYTDAGRKVFGGGGITPDLVILPDTLSTREQLFRSTVVKGGVSPVNAAFDFAVKWVADHPALRKGFEVTPAIRDAFYTYLVEELGVDVDRALYDDSGGYVDWLLGLEIANAGLGEGGRLERRIAFDRQVGEALGLLRQASTPQELFALAERGKASADAAAVPTPRDDR